MKQLRKYSIVLLLAPVMFLHGQTVATGDSLSLKAVLNQVVTNYPAIKKAEQDINAASAKIDFAKSGYLPDVNFSASYTRIGPTTSLTMPGLGSLQLYPEDNYSAAVNVYETIYDFGKTAQNVSVEKKGKEMMTLSAEQIKQKLSQGVVGVYYSMVFLQEAIRIKDQQLATLKGHLDYVQKKKVTGSATSYEVLTTQVRISATENQKLDLQAMFSTLNTQLTSLMGANSKTVFLVKKDLLDVAPLAPIDTLLSVALKTRQDIKLAEQKKALIELRYKAVGMQNNPVFNFYASGGFKNGYFNDKFQDTGKLDYAVGVGFKMLLFDANRTKNMQKQISADIESSKQDIELTRRTITNEVVENQANLQTSVQKLQQSELQLQQAQKAYALAETSFQSGVITNLELLDNATALSEARLQVLKANIDYSLNLYKLKIALGEQVY